MSSYRKDGKLELPLRGIRVADLTQAWAGPDGTMFLADWGAEVIRIESRHIFHAGTRGLTPRPPKIMPNERTWSRAYPDWEPGPQPWNRDPSFNVHSRNKLSMILELQRPEGTEVFKRLVEISDVVIENNAPDLLDKLGLGYEALKGIKPDLVMVRMPAYGGTGPYRNYRAWGSHIEGAIGHTWIRGYRDVDPSMKDDVYPSDAVGGLTAAFSTLIALRHRDLTGEGQLIDAALSEALLPALGEAFLEYTMNGRVQSAMENMDTSMAPHGVYRCKGGDRWVTIAVGSDEEWDGLCRAMGHPSWARDVRYNHVLSRWRNQEEMDRHIETWAIDLESRDVMSRLQKEGVPSGMVQDVAQAHRDPHLLARNFFQDLTHSEAGTHRYPGIVGRMSGLSNSLRSPAPCLGEHNEYVYRELLGYSQHEYLELERAGHIGKDFAPELA